MLSVKKQHDDKRFAALRAPYIPQLETLIDKDTSIISSNCYIKEFAKYGEAGDPYRKGNIYYKELIEKLRSSK